MMTHRTRVATGMAVLMAGLALGPAAATFGGQKDRFIKVFLPGGTSVTAELASRDAIENTVETAHGLGDSERVCEYPGLA